MTRHVVIGKRDLLNALLIGPRRNGYSTAKLSVHLHHDLYSVTRKRLRVRLRPARVQQLTRKPQLAPQDMRDMRDDG